MITATAKKSRTRKTFNSKKWKLPTQFKLPKIRLTPQLIRKIILIIGALLILLFSIYIFRQNDIFAIKSIKCQLEDQPCSTSYHNLVKHLYGSNLIYFNQTDYSQQITARNYLIETIHAHKQYPSTLSVNFILRKPVAILIDGRSQAFQVDKHGVVYAYSQSSDLPKIYANETISLSEKIASLRIAASIDLVNLLQDSQIQISEVEIIPPQSLKIGLQSGEIVYLSFLKDMEKQVDALQLILQNSKMIKQDNNLSRIDLRFKSAVVN